MCHIHGIYQSYIWNMTAKFGVHIMIPDIWQLNLSLVHIYHMIWYMTWKPKAPARTGSRIALEMQQHKGFGLQGCLMFSLSPECGGATEDRSKSAWASQDPSGRRWQSRAARLAPASESAAGVGSRLRRRRRQRRRCRRGREWWACAAPAAAHYGQAIATMLHRQWNSESIVDSKSKWFVRNLLVGAELN
jgi:hypothetical protein